MGYNVPPSESDAIDEALAAISHLDSISNDIPVAEEEEVITEWDEERDEDFEDAF